MWPYSLGGVFLIFFFSRINFTSMASGTRRNYEDLDAPEAMDEWLPSLVHLTSTPSSSSGGSKGKKKQRASERDPTIPPQDYLVFARTVAMDYFRIRSLEMLQRSFLDHGDSGLMRLQEDVERELHRRFSESEEYNNVFTYFGYTPWMARQVVSYTANAIHTFETVYKKPKGEDYTGQEKSLLAKLKEVQRFASKHSST